jgi:Rps23 Pro-64 3,4-dihydroxylase Tpa1-like proline 4-hydroxylase
MLNNHNWAEIKDKFQQAKPFNHVVIDNFFKEEVAVELAKEFPSYDSGQWSLHMNAIENKKSCNRWGEFPKNTYRAFFYLTTQFVETMQAMLDDPALEADSGLQGGGWHAHSRGGKNNIHLDYSIHPKLGLQRKLNIIIYMTPDWDQSWGGGLELWNHDSDTELPGQLITTVNNCFNRAIIFDTTQNSWHGLPKEIACPEGVVRQSLAVYYVTTPEESANPRGRALFVPYGEQANDPAVLELIKQRSIVK